MSGVLCVLMGASSAFNFNATISANTTNYNLNSAMTAAGWNGIDRVIATVTVNSGVYLGSTTNATSALVVGALPAASTVAITNNGYIYGKGGDGNGGAGGPALTIGYATTITNNNVIGGGGGAGGIGADFVSDGSYGIGQAPGSGGGGGAGYLVGSGGAISSTGYSDWIGINGGSTSGASGNTAFVDGAPPAGGAGGTAAFGFTEYVSPNSYATAGKGGAGGSLGVAGSAGTRAVRSGEDIGNITMYNTNPGTGGAAGNCTTAGSNAYITWAVEGTRYGTLA